MKRISVFFLITLIGTGLLTNCHRHKSFEDRVEWISSKLSSKLDLDDSQQKTLDKIKKEIIAKKKDMHPQREKMMAEIIAEVKKDSFDKEKINTLFESKRAQQTEMRKFFIDKMAEFHAVLKPEQRKELGELMEKFAKKHGKRHKH